MGVQNIPLTGSQFEAGLLQTGLAASKLHLVNATFSPGPNDTLAAMAAIECTFSGYTAGGYALTTWLPPAFDPQGGSHVVSPQINVVFTPPMGTPVTETVFGWYLTDTTGAILIANGTFTIPIPMVAAGDAFPITIALVFGNKTVLVECWVFGNMQ